MALFLNLPDDLCKELLSEWTAIKDWGWLDVALCSSKCRRRYLDLMSRSLISSTSECRDHYYEWVKLRRIELHTIYLGTNLESNIGDLIRTSQLSCIRSFHARISGDFSSFINYLTNLTTLTCTIGNVNFSAVNPDVFSRLISLEIIDDWLIAIPEVPSSIHHCRSLMQLKWPFENQTQLAEIIRNNPMLTTIQSPMSIETLTLLTASCRQIASVECYGQFDFPSIAAVLKCPNLMQLCSEGNLCCAWKKNEAKFEMRHCDLRSTDGWFDVVAQLSSLRSIKVIQDMVVDLDISALVNNHVSSVTDLYLWCGSTNLYHLADTISRCSQLRSVFLRTVDLIDFGGMLSPCTALEHLTISFGGRDLKAADVQSVFEPCPALKHFSMIDVWCSPLEMFLLIPAIEDYRNVHQEPMECEFRTLVNGGRTESVLTFDGISFNGDMKVELQPFLHCSRSALTEKSADP